jgi:polyribonucleotide 5'-hydroxyl-kinase
MKVLQSVLPIGTTSNINPYEIKKITIDGKLKYYILAISYANELDEVITSNICGFLYVSDINLEKKEITFLAPSPGKIPKKYLIMGEIKWLDEL